MTPTVRTMWESILSNIYAWIWLALIVVLVTILAHEIHEEIKERVTKND